MFGYKSEHWCIYVYKIYSSQNQGHDTEEKVWKLCCLTGHESSSSLILAFLYCTRQRFIGNSLLV